MKHVDLARFVCAATLVTVLCIAFPASAQTGNPMRPGWIADQKTGCKVWNPAPEPRESIRWSGACKDGFAQGKGTVQWLENGQPGDRFDGEYQHGKRNGFGVVTESDGTRTAGEWKDDELVEGTLNIDFRDRFSRGAQILR
jgi:hypothetical protein